MTFKEWLDEVTIYSSRIDRLCEDLHECQDENFEVVLRWLEAAYKVGYEAGYDAGDESEGYNPI